LYGPFHQVAHHTSLDGVPVKTTRDVFDLTNILDGTYRFDENGRKTPQPFFTSTFDYETKAVKPDTKANTNLQNIENFENELIRTELS